MPGPVIRVPVGGVRRWEDRVFCEKCGTQVTQYDDPTQTMCKEELFAWAKEHMNGR